MASDTLQHLKHRFMSLPQQDRLALTVLAVFMTLVVVIYALILPANRYADSAANHHRERAQLLAWMQANENTARMMSNKTLDSSSLIEGQSMLGLASQTAQPHGISFKRFEPFADGGLRVWLDNTDFNSMLKWLTQLQQQYGVNVLQATIDRGKASGKVTAKLELLLP